MVVPAEHGSWAFLGEPAALGLLVAPSAPGFLLAVAALAAFLARRPLRILVSDRAAGARHPRTRVAERALAVLAAVALPALAAALTLVGPRFLFALLAAAPVAALALALDLGHRSREAAAEIAGALTLGAVASAIALATGWAAGPAFALWGVLAARAVPSIAYVRARLRLDKGNPAKVAGALALHVGAVAAVAALAAAGLVPGLAVGAMILLAGRAAYGLSPARPRLSTVRLGAGEIGFGLLVILCVWLGRLPLS